MKILVINSGSSSLKFQLIDMNTEAVLAKGVVDRIGDEGSGLKGTFRDGKFIELRETVANHVVAVKMLLESLTHADYGIIKSIKEIGAVGHRVVHNGGIFDAPALITDEVIEKMKLTYDLAPLHNSAATRGAIACRNAMPGIPMALVFDTVFHNTMPPKAYMYAIPYEDYEKYKVRKYGFHGTSHMYVSRKAAEYLGKKPEELRIVTCHLGNGASVAAVEYGKCVDTSMGFTPLEGLVMGTRCGDMDLAALEFLCKKKGMTHLEGVDYANKRCGVKGICGYSDFRDITAQADAGDERAQLALEMFSYRVKKYVGSYAAAMGGLDCIVFTAGIGEHTPIARELSMENLEFLGVKFDKQKNIDPKGEVVELQSADSRVKILMIATNEELVIAQETQKLLK